jgi:hypothetical protein
LNFGLDPVLDGTSWERRTHFEQAYDSAALAAQNAVTSLGFASEAEFQLRATAASERDLALDALSQDLDYRDRLIAIYGTPYEGTIGPGKIYDEGYSGPDTLLYMYVDRTDLKDFTPGPDSRYTELTNSLQSLSRNWSALDSGLSLLLGGRDSTKKVLELFDDFYITLPWEELELGSAGESGDEENVIRIAAPVISTGSYAFQAPDDWGARRAPGQIQILINQLLAAEHERDLALEAYNEFVRSVSIKQERLELQLRRLQASADSRDNAQGTLAALDSLGIFFETVAKTAEALATDTWREALAVGSTFPYIVGAMANDTFSAARGAAEQAGVIGSSKSGYVALAFSIAGSLNEVTKAVIERLAEGDRDRVEDYDELLEMLSEFALEVSEEERMRAPIVTALQQMDMIAQQIRSLQAEGQRIQNERAAFNMVLAANAQRNRYQDMVTRLTRNDALGRYQNAFDNALRFVWLAARAYDYETSLSPGDPAAATTFLEEIVRTRQLGAWQDGEPRIGNGGLAEILAQLMGNFQALRGQIGLNNPQHETGDLSLRREHFRILLDSASDSRWRQTLLAARVDDLWKVPEFVHFCRPFAARDQGPQPGLVIEFATSIQSGENVFGRPLAGGDNAYSTASYATKIHSAGAWFEGYDPSRLSGTPRVYLIPAGNDVLRIANSPEPQIRIWSIVEQRIPVPFLINRERLADPNFIPSIDSLNGSFAPIRRFGDFRAYYSASGQAPDLGEVPKDARLFGRSVWNTRWLLIIPGATLGSDPSASLDAFINQVTDIRLLFDTYSNPGI